MVLWGVALNSPSALALRRNMRPPLAMPTGLKRRLSISAWGADNAPVRIVPSGPTHPNHGPWFLMNGNGVSARSLLAASE